MERKNLALLCAGVVCFWLFALAFGTAQGNGLRQQNPAVQAAADQTQPVQPAAAQPALELPCRAACLIDQQTGTILYEKNAAHLLHHGAVRRLHLNGADLKQHGHGQVNTGGDHGQQGHKGHQPPQHPPPLQCSAGQAALLAFFPLYRVAWLLLCRAQTLVFVALLRCLSRCLARLLPL